MQDLQSPAFKAPKSWGLLALGTLAVLFLLAVVFWKERVFFGDASWIAFRIINFGTLQIQEHRYGSFITQSVPLLAMKMGLSLHTVLLLYSLSFNAFYLLAGYLLFRWRQYDFLLLLALYFTVSISVGFYWTNNEIHQGTAWLMLFFGWTSREKIKDWIFYSVAFALCFLALSSHMLILLSGGCVWMHLLLSKRAPFYGTRKGVFLVVFAVGAAIWRYYMSKVEGWYDADKLSFIDNLKWSKIAEAFSGKSSLGFLERWPTHYGALPALVFLAFVVLVAQKRWWAAVWHLLSLAAFWFFISAAFADFTPWYSESDWASWTLSAIVPLALYGFPFGERKAVGTVFLALVLFISLLRIYQSASPFRERLQRVEKLVTTLQNRNLTKVAFVVSNMKALEEKMLLPWSLPAEVNELSAMHEKNTFSVGIVGNPAQIPAMSDTLLIPFGTLPARSFHPAYFSVDSTQSYVLLPADSLLRWLK